MTDILNYSTEIQQEAKKPKSLVVVNGRGEIFNAAEIINADGFKTIDTIHQNVHDGIQFIAANVFKNVPNLGYARLYLKSLPDKEVHIEEFITTDAKCYFNLYVNTVLLNLNSPGTQLTKVKLNGTNENLPQLNVYHTPTISNAGDLIFPQLINGGTGPQSVGGSGGRRIEAILKLDTTYLIEVQNVSGQAKDIGIVLLWYEKEIGG